MKIEQVVNSLEVVDKHRVHVVSVMKQDIPEQIWYYNNCILPSNSCQSVHFHGEYVFSIHSTTE